MIIRYLIIIRKYSIHNKNTHPPISKLISTTHYHHYMGSTYRKYILDERRKSVTQIRPEEK